MTEVWQPLLPDLTPLDFHFCGLRQGQRLRSSLPLSLREPSDRIREAVMSVGEGILRSVLGIVKTLRVTTSRTHDRKLECWATVVGQLIFQ
jgi:hypothetical protein